MKLGKVIAQDYFVPLMMSIAAAIIIVINCIIIFTCPFIVCIVAILITMIVIKPILNFIERKCN